MKFYEAYKELEQIARDMQDDPEKVIDEMETKLKRAMELNKFCSDRLNKVQEMLDQYKSETAAIENGSSFVKKNAMNQEESSDYEAEEELPF